MGSTLEMTVRSERSSWLPKLLPFIIFFIPLPFASIAVKFMAYDVIDNDSVLVAMSYIANPGGVIFYTMYAAYVLIVAVCGGINIHSTFGDRLDLYRTFRDLFLFSVLFLVSFAAVVLSYRWHDGMRWVPNSSYFPFLRMNLMVAVCEEWVFRGVAYQMFSRHFTWHKKIWIFDLTAPVLLAALIFSAYHYQSGPVGFLTFFPGILFGLLRARTGNIIAPMIFHIMCNVTSMYVSNA